MSSTEMPLAAHSPELPAEPSLREHESQRLRETMANLEASQQELIRTAVNDAINRLVRDNRSLQVQIQERTNESRLLREQDQLRQRDFASLEERLSEQAE